MNWEPLTVVSLNFATTSFLIGNLTATLKASCSLGCAMPSSRRVMFRALLPFLPGQTFAQLPQPVQSSADIVITKLKPGIPMQGIAFSCASFGAFFSSSSVMITGLITACGQTYEQKLHWIQLAPFQAGTSTAIPLFSNAAEP